MRGATRFARNEGLPFADILTETSIRKVLSEHGVKFRDRVYQPGHDHLGLSKLRCSAKTTVAAMPCRESSHIVRPVAKRFARPMLPATAMRGVAFSQMFYALWQREPQKSYAGERYRPMEVEQSICVHFRWL